MTRRTVIGLVAAALMVALIGGLFVALDGGSRTKTLHGPSGNAFEITYLNDWKPLSAAGLAQLSTDPVGALIRKDGKGFMTITRHTSANGVNGQKLAKELNARFKRRLGDYTRVSAVLLTTPAGRVFFYSYLRTKKRTLNTIAIIPAGDHSYVMDTVSNPKASDVAAQIIAMVRSFKPG
jgi:hypothetical protein